MNSVFKIKNIIIFCFIFLMMPFYSFAFEENCYGDHALGAKEKDYYKLSNGFCIYPEQIEYPARSEEDKNYPFLGYGAYEWDIFGQNYNKNVSIISDLRDCGEREHPCYCDSSIKPDNPIFEQYCCPSYPGDCPRDSDLIYENRPFFTVYRSSGDLDVKGNLAISGKSTFFLKANSLIGFFNQKVNSLFLALKAKFHDVVASGRIFINKNIIFNRKHGSVQLSDNSQVSKVKRNKIIRASLQGKHQGVGWKEINTHELLNFDFENLTAIADGNDCYYLVDNGNKKIIKIFNVMGEDVAVSVGNDDWAWRPVDLTVSGEQLYITSTYDEYSEIDNSFFRITSPSADVVYKVGEKIVISWSKIPKANEYFIYYKKNNGNFEEIILRDDKNSYEIEATSDLIGNYVLSIGASVEGKKVFTDNFLTFSITDNFLDIFRITSPRYGTSSPKLQSDFPNYVLEYFTGDDIYFSWDKHKDANQYKLVYSVNSGPQQETGFIAGNTTEMKAGPGGLNAGDYRFRVRAYRGDTLVKESANEKVFSVHSARKEIKSLSDNVFSLRISGNDLDSHRIESWSHFIPDPYDFEGIRNYEILKEYYEFANNDPAALYLENPSGISNSEAYLYIADTGNDRIVRLSKSLAIPFSLAENLRTIKNDFVPSELNMHWQNEVDESLKDQLNNYWQVIYGNGSVKSDFVYNIANRYTPLGELNKPRGVLYSGGLHIVDTGNKRIVFQDIFINDQLEDWHQIQASDWSPINMIRSGSHFYVADAKNGSIVRIDVSRGVGSEYSYFTKGLVYNDSYFVFGMRGQEDYNFSYPVDLINKGSSFYVLDGVSDTGYAMISGVIATTSTSSVVNLYSEKSSRMLNGENKNPYNNEFNGDARADKIKIDESVSLFNDEQNELRHWVRGPAISHCNEECSQGYDKETRINDCETPYEVEWEYTCNGCMEDTVILGPEGENLCDSGCTDRDWDAPCVNTCRGQWDWYANAPTCQKYIIEWNIVAHPNDPCKMCPKTCYGEECDEEGNCSPISWSCPYPCGTTYTADPECVPFEYDCRAGYSVGFEDYTYKPFPDGYAKYPDLESKVRSIENTHYSLKDGWPDWVLGGGGGALGDFDDGDSGLSDDGSVDEDDIDTTVLGELYYAGGVCLDSPSSCWQSSLQVYAMRKDEPAYDAEKFEMEDVLWRIKGLSENNHNSEGNNAWYRSGDRINVFASQNTNAEWYNVFIEFMGPSLDALEEAGFEVDRTRHYKILADDDAPTYITSFTAY